MYVLQLGGIPEENVRGFILCVSVCHAFPSCPEASQEPMLIRYTETLPRSTEVGLIFKMYHLLKDAEKP